MPSPAAIPRHRFFDADGAPLAFGLLYPYAAGTTTPLATYQDSAGATPNEHPIELDGNGECVLWLGDSGAYDFALTDADGNPQPVQGLNVQSMERVSSTALENRLASTSSASDGDAMVAELRTATGAVATTTHAHNEKRKFDVAIDFGVTSASSAATVKAALQLAISAAGALARGGTVEVPAYLNYGFDVTDRTTWPSFTGITVPVCVIDYSQGASYGSYPTTYDGCQQRIWMHTPQTTSPGQHDGNTQWVRGTWAPNICISNDMDLSGARAATDNRRASFTLFTNGEATYRLGQGTREGSSLTDEELGNFVIEKYAATSDTIASVWAMFLGERETHRMSYGGGANSPLAAHDFYPGNPSETLDLALFRTPSATTTISLQSSAGTSARSFLRNNAGVTELGSQTGGAAIKLRQADSFAEFGSGSSYSYHFNFQASRATNWVHFVNNTNATDGFVQRLQSASTQSSSWDFLGCYANAGADTRLRIIGNGNVVNANNSYGAISDEKLKQDIEDAGSAWDDFKGYRFRKYRFKADPFGGKQLGVIAQEVEAVSPGLVEESDDFEIDEDGERVMLGTVTKSVKYSVLFMKACVALQEAMTRIEALERRISDLEK